MDIYEDDILAFWKVLYRFDVSFIMVGGFAINIHGYTRATEDIDIWVNDIPENRKRLAGALDELSIAPYEIVETMQFVPGWTQMNLPNGFPLDIMTSVKGLENYSFQECLHLAQRINIENVIVPFLHINHLLTAKKAVNRPKDQLDVIELEKIKAWLEQHPDGNI